ncbi:SGNH/GDSL hydrolase family protein [Sorangium sp. So ce693]|uniref:SGNH/GDSL hydrolase family protein n=1 Tax=Sorangium sp. So ce693 TaxID=3133318 RepID=UPI003F6303C4
MQNPSSKVYIEGAIAAGAAVERLATVNSIVDGRLDQQKWRVTAPMLAPRVRGIYAKAGSTGPRRLVVVNYDGYCPAGGYLEQVFTVPDEWTELRIELDDVQLPDDVASSPAFELQIYDATGITLLHSTAVTPSSTPTDVKTVPIPVTPGVEYRVRVACNVSGQARFAVGWLRVRPTVTTNGFWSNFVRIDVCHEILNDNLESGYANPRYAAQSPFSHVDLLFSGDRLAVEVLDNAGDYLADRARPSVFVNGVPLDPPLDTNIGGIAHCIVKMPPSTGMQAVTICAGPQAVSGLPAPVTEPRGSFIRAVYVPRYSRVEVLPERPSASGETIVLFGDSKLAGFYSSSPGRDSIVHLLRAAGHRVICAAVGGDTLFSKTGATLSVAACLPIARKLVREDPTQVIFGMGRNDIKAALFNATDFLTQAGNAADAIHQADTDVQVKFLAFSHETAGTEETALDTVRAGMRTLAAARSPWCSFLDGAALWSVAEANNYTTDQVHPNDAGQERKASLILGPGDEYPWSPMQVANLFAWWEPGPGMTGGPMSAVTPQGSSPPTVTLSGTAVMAGHFRFEVKTAGAGGSASPAAKGRWSFYNGGRSWVQQDVPLTPTVSIAPLGITVNFSSGTYPNNAVYLADVHVGQVPDLSGNGRHLVGSTNQFPPFKLNGINGKPCLSYVPVDFMRLTGINIPAPYAIFVVGKYTSQASVRALLGKTSASSGMLFYSASSTTMAVNDGTVQRAVTVDATVARCYGIIVNGASSQIRVDGVASTVSLSNNPLTGLGVGADSESGFGLDGEVASVIVVAGLPSEDECKAIEARARARWATA